MPTTLMPVMAVKSYKTQTIIASNLLVVSPKHRLFFNSRNTIVRRRKNYSKVWLKILEMNLITE